MKTRTVTYWFLNSSWIENSDSEVATSGTKCLHDESCGIASCVSDWLQPCSAQTLSQQYIKFRSYSKHTIDKDKVNIFRQHVRCKSRIPIIHFTWTIGTNASGVCLGSKWCSRFQLAVWKLRKVSHHAKFIHLRVAHLHRLYQLQANK